MVNYVKGNLLDSNCDYICHQVNCQGRMGSGIAKQIKEKWPEVYTAYLGWYEDLGSAGMYKNIMIVPVENDQNIVNFASQFNYGYDGKQYTSYDAFWNCLLHLKSSAKKGAKIGFPARIGCGLGGANWMIIQMMIVEVLGRDFDVYIYELEGA